MATVTVREFLSGSRYIVKEVYAVGGDSTTETVVIEAAETVDPNGVAVDDEGTSIGDCVLVGAEWWMSNGFDAMKLYYEDETFDLLILPMAGDSGSFDFSIMGGATAEEVGDEGTIEANDLEVKIDVLEGAGEAAGAADTAYCRLLFKRKSR